MSLVRFLLLSLCLVTAFGKSGFALGLIRDPDIEYSLKQLATPVLKSAGLSPSRVDILVINDPSMNAFVVDQNHIFIHSGLLLRMKTSAMLQSVIAHETAHIANGHLARRPIAARNAKTAAQIGAALAMAAGIAAGRPDVGASIAAGASNTALRLLLTHTRAEENSADQSGMRFLANSGIDPQGSVDAIDLFRGQESLDVGRQDPYALTHPLSADRYRVLKQQAAAYAGYARPQPEYDYWFARAKAKLSAFQRDPSWTMKRLGEFSYADVNNMREAVAWLRRSNLKKSLASIDQAIALRPNDPYYQELRGQILMDSRQFAAASNAYAKAVNMAPNNALILGAYGHALLAEGKTAQALKYLESARSRDPGDARVMRDLGSAYAKSGNNGMASLVTAERYALSGQFKDAVLHAKRASDLLPPGSTGYQRAQDILRAAKQAN